MLLPRATIHPEHAGERALALMAIAQRAPVDARYLRHFRKSMAAWGRGERAIAQFHLAYAGISPLRDKADAKRLFLAEALIEEGFLPLWLAKEVNAEQAPPIEKYSPDQPRNPAGSGEISGRWTSGDITISDPAPKSPGLIGRVASALGFLSGLARRASPVGTAIEVFRTIFVPSPNEGVIALGEIPGWPGHLYVIDHDTGTLKIDASGTGAFQPIVAQLGPDGIYREAESGVMVAQNLGDRVVLLDPDVLATLDQPREGGDASRSGGPKLCPDPVAERGGSADPFASIYQQFIRNYINPQRSPQMPPSLTIALPSSTPSGWVYFDDCHEATGTMIEAKSDRTGYMHSEKGASDVADRYFTQGKKQFDVLGDRKAQWYFHRKENADLARRIFTENGWGDKLSVVHLPYPGNMPAVTRRTKKWPTLKTAPGIKSSAHGAYAR